MGVGVGLGVAVGTGVGEGVGLAVGAGVGVGVGDGVAVGTGAEVGTAVGAGVAFGSDAIERSGIKTGRTVDVAFEELPFTELSGFSQPAPTSPKETNTTAKRQVRALRTP